MNVINPTLTRTKFTGGMREAWHFLFLIIIPFVSIFISCTRNIESEKQEEVKKVRVRVEDYKKTDYELKLNYSGEVKAWKTVNLSFNIPGKIDQFFVDEGGHVNKGELLARLEQDDFQAARDQAYANWEKAKRDYDRNHRLWKEGSLREQLVLDANTVLKGAKAALDASELNLKHCLLYAPFEGHIAYRFGEEKEMVAPGQVVFTLMDLSRVIIELGVPEKSVGGIKNNQKAQVEFEAIPDRIFSGRVSLVGLSSIPNSRLFKVEVTVHNPSLLIKPGMTATSTIITDILRGIYLFSLDVSVLRNGQRVIFLAEDDKAKRVVLKNFVISGDKIIVQDPLPERGAVITSGQEVLFDNMEISVIEKD